IAINQEVYTPEVLAQLGVSKDELEELKSVEVGNIFNFGQVKSKQLNLMFKNEKGEEVPVHLGSYGIGITRLMGTVVEIMADDRRLVWPESIAPFTHHIIALGAKGDEASKKADDLYEKMQAKGMSVLYDDRDLRAGEKFNDADLIGIPTRIVVGKEALAS